MTTFNDGSAMVCRRSHGGGVVLINDAFPIHLRIRKEFVEYSADHVRRAGDLLVFWLANGTAAYRIIGSTDGTDGEYACELQGATIIALQ